MLDYLMALVVCAPVCLVLFLGIATLLDRPFSERAIGRCVQGLVYDEPPGWMQPVRHTLGAVLLRAGRVVEAEAVYREDLVKYPGNGWSLFGLNRALAKQGRAAEARNVERRFQKAWAGADLRLTSTCLCQPGS